LSTIESNIPANDREGVAVILDTLDVRIEAQPAVTAHNGVPTTSRNTVTVMLDNAGVLAVDIGGTKLAAAVVARDGTIVRRDRISTPQRDPWSALVALMRRMQAATSEIELVACGVACGGPMSSGGESASPLHIPSWREFPLRRSIAEATGLATHVDNDAKALALSEGWLGAAVDHQDFMAVVVGTGVGAGLVSGGRLVDGASGNAGHIGHIVVGDEGRACRCGGLDCLESFISGAAVELGTGRSPAYASAGLVERNGRLLGQAVASVAAMCDIRRVVVGGSVALGWGEPFFDAANREFEARSRIGFTRGLDIVPLGLGDRSALIGAAAVAWRVLV
jgi:glucokinase